MSGLFENERITKLLLDFNLFTVILDVIESQKNTKLRREFTAYAFSNAFVQQKFSFATRLMLDYQPTILQESNRVIPLILPHLYSNPYFMEIKLDLLRIFMPHMLFRFVD
jgi:hypothetical protein